MRLGILTGGGDCPGLNAAIRAVVRHAHEEYGTTVLGFRDGWRGVLEGTIEELGPDEVSRDPPTWRHDPGHVRPAALP